MPDTVQASFANSNPGARYVHTADGPQIVPAARDGQPGTAGPFAVTQGELEQLPPGVTYQDGTKSLDEAMEAARNPQGREGEGGVPDDLRDASKPDGIVSRAALVEVAEREGVEGVKGDDSKAEIVSKIVAKRADTSAE